MRYSFIDFGLEDFLRDENGNVIKVEAEDGQGAHDWLLSHGDEHGWTNTWTQNFCWDDDDE